MSDNQPAKGDDGKPVDDKGGASGKPDDQKPTPSGDSEARFNDLAAKFRKQGERLEALETERNQRKNDDLAKEGKIEELRNSLTAEREAEKKRADDLQGQLHSVIVESQVKTLVAEQAIDVEDVWTLTKDCFEVGQDSDGKPIARVKNSSMSPKEFLAKWFEGKPHLARNPRKGGSGTQQGDKSQGNGAAVTLTDLAKLPDKGRAAMAKDPELARLVLREG